ncbi:MAG: GC-type dockerin domain-anchored protein [Phycisphaerales bacterium]
MAPRSRVVIRLVPTLLALALGVPALGGGTPDLRGVYFHRFTGSFDGTEWLQVFDLDEPGRVHVGDIRAGGAWGATIAGDSITLDTGAGTGTILDADSFEIDFTLPSLSFHSQMTRAPYTDVDFPVRLDSPAPAPAHVSGAWSGAQRDIDPMTGAELVSAPVNVALVASGTSVVAPINGMIVTGVWETPVQAGFRVVVPTALDVRYRSFPGSGITIALNMLGELRLTGRNSIEATLLLQTRVSVGSQVQSLIRVELSRNVPLGEGDVNADGVLTQADLDELNALLGLTDQDDGYSILADLDVDGVIDDDDLGRLGALLNGCPADLAPPFGVFDFSDVLAFITAFGSMDPGADLAPPAGVYDFTDVLAFLTAFGDGCA